ncbi:hypothetical protein EV702DRAFT_142297 [Suillus placidus]|uniref:Uncharacterized protein n=1 Tax=Suillus placidus TaxID=48579 RepID=A0A9P6ZYR1_9AGAM|nr:hypothetical protein EV702DRAFT_142297 [Suillus placidus]
MFFCIISFHYMHRSYLSLSSSLLTRLFLNIQLLCTGQTRSPWAREVSWHDASFGCARCRSILSRIPKCPSSFVQRERPLTHFSLDVLPSKPRMSWRLYLPFIDLDIVPPFNPVSAHDAPPDFRYIMRPVSMVNLTKLLNDDHISTLAVPSTPKEKVKNPITSTIAQQGKEFRKAVESGSPTSALLSLWQTAVGYIDKRSQVVASVQETASNEEHQIASSERPHGTWVARRRRPERCASRNSGEITISRDRRSLSHSR